MTDDLVKRLREMASWEDGVGVMQDFYCGDEMRKAADRIEELEAKLEWLIVGAETVLEEWDRGDEAAFREAIEEMRCDVEETKGVNT